MSIPPPPDQNKTIPFIPRPHPEDAPSAIDGTPWDLVHRLRVGRGARLDDAPDAGADDSRIKTPYGRRYRLCGTVGKGGLGIVHLALDRRIGREVAIKQIVAEKSGVDERTLGRFLREARLTGQLEHPGIVPVYEIGVNAEGAPYYVMRYVRGRTLHDCLREEACGKPGSDGMAARLAWLDSLIAVCETMAYAHSHGVIHRDLKPSNIIIGEFGETVVLDWGLAKALDESADRSEQTDSVFKLPDHLKTPDRQLSIGDEIMGTPGYMSPEQVSSMWGEVDRQTDVYALGCMLHALLTGNAPYSGTVMEIIDELERKNPTPAFQGVWHEIPPELKAICERAIVKDRALRFKDAGELARELKAYRDGRMVSVHSYTRRELLSRFASRNKGWLTACAAALVALVIGTALAVTFGLRAHSAQLAAMAALDRSRQAMMEITSRSDRATRLSTEAADMIALSMSTLTAELMLHGPAVAAADTRAATLQALWGKHPEVEDFLLVDMAGSVVASANNRNPVAAAACLKAMPKAAPGADAAFSPPTVLDGQGVWLVCRVPVVTTAAPDVTLQFAALLNIDGWIKAAIAPITQTYEGMEVWCIDSAGLNISDHSVKEVGHNLLTDPMYQPFAELRAFAQRMIRDCAGAGYYANRNPDDTVTQYRVAAWQTAVPAADLQWKICAMSRYLPAAEGDLPAAHE